MAEGTLSRQYGRSGSLSRRGLAKLRYHSPFLASLAILIGAWEFVGRTADLLILPPLSDIVAEFWQFIIDGTFVARGAVSLISYGLGMAASITVGTAAGFLMARYRKVEYALDMYVNAAMTAPMIAFVPLLIILFGLGYLPRVIAVVLFAMFPILINTFSGIRNVDRSLVEMGRSFGATEGQLFWQIRVPGAFPLIAAGLHLGAARGVKGVINGEVLIAVVGIGALVNQFGTAFSMDKLYAVIFFIVATAFILVRAVDMAVGRLVRH